MKILILTTYYPPDTAIAAVRPYMLAKYLSRMGHTVTVLRSGEINKSCENFYEPLPDVRVISYLGANSFAERYERGEVASPQIGKSRIGFLPVWLRLPIAKVYHCLADSRPKETVSYREQRNARFEIQKAALDSLSQETFDFVFSTYGELENVFAGQYAAELFNSILIQDFRDCIAAKLLQKEEDYKILKKIQDDAVRKADAYTAASDGLLKELSACVDMEHPCMVLYNGYEPYEADSSDNSGSDSQCLNLCYTGQVYQGLSDISSLLEALAVLIQQKKIHPSRVKIHYAGANFDSLKSTADAQGLGNLLIDHGYVNKTEAARIQGMSDLFLVLSWNTADSQGILTGKFYEGIRAQKPILSIVSGDMPNSELALLNEKYQYGFCYEMCQRNSQFSAFCDFLLDAYTQKMKHGRVRYHPVPELFSDFRYDVLAKKLSDFCETLIEEKKQSS